MSSILSIYAFCGQNWRFPNNFIVALPHFATLHPAIKAPGGGRARRRHPRRATHLAVLVLGLGAGTTS
jgi:hypothetical protein